VNKRACSLCVLSSWIRRRIIFFLYFLLFPVTTTHIILSWNKFIHRCNIRWCSFRYQNKFMHNILNFFHMHHTQNNHHHHHHINVKIIIPFSVGNRLLQTNSIQFWIVIWRKLVISRYVSEIASIIIFSIWCSWPISKVGD